MFTLCLELFSGVFLCCCVCADSTLAHGAGTLQCVWERKCAKSCVCVCVCVCAEWGMHFTQTEAGTDRSLPDDWQTTIYLYISIDRYTSIDIHIYLYISIYILYICIDR